MGERFTSDRRICLGRVGVDSGQLMVIGPCYVDSDLDADFYDQVSALTRNGPGGQLKYGGTPPGVWARAGVAVAFSSGSGDGAYPVYATVRDLGELARRVVKVEIELVPEEEQEDWRT